MTTEEKTKREAVYAAINSERDFQDILTSDPGRKDMIDVLHMGDALSAIQYNLSKAVEKWYAGATPHQEAMEYLRKIAALCVKAGEVYGMPYRIPTK